MLNGEIKLFSLSDGLWRVKALNRDIRKGIIEAGNGYIAVQKPIEYDGDEEILLKSKELAKCKGASVAFSKADGNPEVRAKGQ